MFTGHSLGVHVSVFKFPLFIRTPIIMDSGPTLLQSDLILANYICNTSFQIRSHFKLLRVRTWAYELGET